MLECQKGHAKAVQKTCKRHAKDMQKACKRQEKNHQNASKRALKASKEKQGPLSARRFREGKFFSVSFPFFDKYLKKI
jgi:hypothetical protein